MSGFPNCARETMDLCFLKNLQGRATTKSLVVSISQAIDDGLLKSGDKLPSSREIAQFSGTSRTTVVRAFDELIARGYLNGKKGQATYVAQMVPDSEVMSFEPPVEEKPPTFSDKLPVELLPIKEWQKCLAMQLTMLTTKQFKQDPKCTDHHTLKHAICGFLRRTEGFICFPRNLFVFTGTSHALEFIAKLTANAEIACENKGSKAFELFQRHGASVSELSIDSAGARIDAMGTPAPHLQYLYVTPTGSRPSGITLSDARRYELLEWARIHSGTIIENATGTEFQYTAKSNPSLFAQDRTGCVIYHRSLAGLFQPLANLEFLLIPDKLLDQFCDCCPGLAQTPTVEHLALAEFINNGFLEKHIRSAWKVLRRRRQMLIYSMKQRFDKDVEIYASHAGTQIVVRFTNHWTAEIITHAAAASGLSLSVNHILGGNNASHMPEFIIDFATLKEEQTEASIKAFAEKLTTKNVISTPPPMQSLVYIDR